MVETVKPALRSQNPGISPKAENILSKSCFSEQEIDADLKLIIERWPGLSLDIKRMITKIVETS